MMSLLVITHFNRHCAYTARHTSSRLSSFCAGGAAGTYEIGDWRAAKVFKYDTTLYPFR